MAVNRERPHLMVLPEDDATRSLAVGFVDVTSGQMQVLNPARGWPHVLQEFTDSEVNILRKYKERHLVLLIDFDNDFPTRMPWFKSKIPLDIADRVYVLGAFGEAEDLKKQTGKKLGPLGQMLAKECEEGTVELWMHGQLQHNQDEVQRLKENVKHFLF